MDNTTGAARKARGRAGSAGMSNRLPEMAWSNVRLALFFLLIPPIGLLDEVSGLGISLLPIYFIPIVLSSWFGGPAFGGAAAFLTIITWVISNIAFPNHTQLPMAVQLAWGTVEKAILFTLVTFAATKLHSLLDREKQRSLTDFVTDLPNRRAFMRALERTIGEAGPFSLAFMELDGMEDLYLDRGELFAEGLLFDIASVCSDRVQGFRYSDQRFAVLFPETSGPAAAKRMSGLMTALNRDVLGARELDLRLKVGIAYCEEGTQVSIPLLLRFLAGTMRFPRAEEGEHLDFCQLK